MRVHRADANLNQTFDLASLHHARKRAAVAQRTHILAVIQIGMAVDMQDVQPFVPVRMGLDQRIGHRVIPAQRQHPRAGFDPRGSTSLDPVDGLLPEHLEHVQITGILEPVGRAQISAVLSRQVGRAGMQRLADAAGGKGGALQE